MIFTTQTLVQIADAFRDASGGLKESTLSYRIFGDSKKLTSMRTDADITLGRFNAAMHWFAENWPEGHVLPDLLHAFTTENKDAA